MLTDALRDRRQRSVLFTAVFSLLALFLHYNYWATGTTDILRSRLKPFPYRIAIHHNETEILPVVDHIDDLEQAPFNATLGVRSCVTCTSLATN
jgi:hypothetical protein